MTSPLIPGPFSGCQICKVTFGQFWGTGLVFGAISICSLGNKWLLDSIPKDDRPVALGLEQYLFEGSVFRLVLDSVPFQWKLSF